MMFENLVKSLRICGDSVDAIDECCYEECIQHERPIDPLCMKALCNKAADAIEELSRAKEELAKQVAYWQARLTESMCGETLAELEKPRWIPVTERLPEKDGTYLVCGRWRGKPIEIWVCESITLGPIKGWANMASNPVISHWMPLPEPPKEET